MKIMKKVPLLFLLWTIAFFRAALIVGCLLIVYSVVYAFLNAISAIPRIEWFYPAIGGALIFVCILLNDATWVNEKKEKY